MEKIIIYDGVYTSLSFHLEDFDFTGIQKVIFTVKNSIKTTSRPVITREFTENRLYTVLISPEEAELIKNNAYYDFDEIIDDGSRLKISENGQISKVKGVGHIIDDTPEPLEEDEDEDEDEENEEEVENEEENLLL